MIGIKINAKVVKMDTSRMVLSVNSADQIALPVQFKMNKFNVFLVQEHSVLTRTQDDVWLLVIAQQFTAQV